MQEKNIPIFVYGTLMSGEINSHFLDDCILVGEDETTPHWDLIDFGGCPGLTPGNRRVKGEVYLADQDTKDILDKLEGHPFLYRRIPMTLLSGKRVETYKTCYASKHCKIIKSGSWRWR